MKTNQTETASVYIPSHNVGLVLDAECDRPSVMLLAHLNHEFVIGVQDRDAAGFQAFDQFSLGRRYALDRSQIFERHRRYQQLLADIRWSDLAKTLNLVC